ncbi:calcium-binding protein [Neisseria weixii]|uniref:calcium-binding protein n=1 Tax=Neisseria weixii TaxID=1853276 RepID=UPI001E5D270C|nr:calcium-binding protein [Neisseria weixii]
MFEQYAEQLGGTALTKLGHQLGTDADETLRGTDLSNFLLGGEGNDTLEGRNGDDILSGGNGHDTLNGGTGNDTLTGGAGNDKLNGGSSEADTYVFAKGHGQDVVSDSGSKAAHTDTLVFTGAKLSDTAFIRNGYNLIVKAYGSEDQVTLDYFFYNGDRQNFNFVFDDQTVKGADVALTVNGTEQNETLQGWSNADTVNGGAGNDTIYGYEGNDVLNGADGDDRLEADKGNDRLLGESGNDTLVGGSGSDILMGGEGNDRLEGGSNEADTYVFTKGHGTDTVSDYGSKDEHIDTLLFDGAEFSDAVFSRFGNDLVVKAYGEGDQVNVQNFFSSSHYRYTEFAFEDKTVSANDAMNAVAVV